ncbi:hypothetical protein [Candidatus Mycoplasma haematobovis]|nr:hypothetical protein [Candidatus Mycoplasma haematobovis]
MTIPYFNEENEFIALSKVKAFPLIRQLRDIDRLIFWLCLVPMCFNFIWYIVIRGSNSLTSLFISPIAILRENSSFSDWGRMENFFFLLFLLSLGAKRLYISRKLFLKMQATNFEWNDFSKIRLMLLVPILSIKIYQEIEKSYLIESVHYYN